MIRHWFSNLSLRVKITCITLAVTTVALAIVTGMSILQLREQMNAQQHLTADSVATSVALASELALSVEDTTELSRLADSFLHNQDILFVAIYGDRPAPFALAVRDQSAWDAYLAGRSGGSQCILTEHTVEAIDSNNDLTGNQNSDPHDVPPAPAGAARHGAIGRVVIGISATSPVAAQWRQSRVTAATALAAASVCGIALFLILGTWARRLQGLAVASQTIARGDFEGPIYDEHEDEIGQLARDLERMRLALHWREQKLNEFTETLQDQVKQRTRDLEHALSSAEEANRAKSLFLANMSHELRTPLNGVIGMVDLLLTICTDPQQRRYCDIAKVSARSLLDLISDILDFSKIEAGKLELDATDFDFHDLLQDISNIFVERAEKKKLNLLCDVKSNVPHLVNGDPVRMRQVLLNLVSNAIKFTDKGAVTIRATVVEEDSNEAQLKIEVQDSGIGIPPQRLDRLFKSFSQVDASTTRKFGGTGLGLAISQRIAGLMGGQMGVQSQVGAGSVFWFTAKLKKRIGNPSGEGATARVSIVPRRPGSNSAGQSASSLKMLQGLRVLLAEDNEVNQIVATELLQHAGCVVTVVNNGRQALERSAQDQFDAALMDCQMPEMDGFEATRQIRRREKDGGGKTHLPIIALTANAIKGDREICLEVGMDHYVTKPIEPAELFKALAIVTNRQTSFSTGQSAPAAPAQPQTPTTTDGEIPPVDFKSLHERCLGNRKLAAKALEKFTASISATVDDLDQQFHKGEPKAAKAVAHKLKGAAANVSAEKIRHLAAELEKLADPMALTDAESRLALLRTEVDRLKEYIAKALAPELASASASGGKIIS